MSRLLSLWKELGREHAEEFDISPEEATRRAILAVVWLLLLVGEVAVVASVAP